MYFTSAFTVEGIGSNFVPYALFNGEGGTAEHEMMLACINSESVPQHMQRNHAAPPDRPTSFL